MRYHFDEIKTTQIASLLLSQNDGKMNYMKLIKLLYLIDREALLKWGFPLTCDRYVSMDKGPVLSNTYNLIMEGVQDKSKSYWYDHISEPANYSVELLTDAGDGELSDAEIELITKIDAKYKDKDQWDMVEIVHELPEWVDPEGSSVPIQYEDILREAGKTEVEIANYIKEIEALHLTSMLLENVEKTC